MIAQKMKIFLLVGNFWAILILYYLVSIYIMLI